MHGFERRRVADSVQPSLEGEHIAVQGFGLGVVATRLQKPCEITEGRDVVLVSRGLIAEDVSLQRETLLIRFELGKLV